jgi:hypothetical protein
MSIVYRELINSTINKLSSSIKKSKKPMVSLTINGHKIKALYDTGADLCCMTAAKFRQLFPVGQRPKKLNVISTVTVASVDKLETLGVYPIPFEIRKKKFVYNVHVLNKLCDDFILGLDFFHQVGLAYEPENHELFWTDKDGAKCKTAELQCPDKLTLEPTSNRVVTLNVVTRRGYRIADVCEAVAIIASKDHVVQGGLWRSSIVPIT